jgi:SEL1 protein
MHEGNYEPDEWDSPLNGMPGGDDQDNFYDEFDDGILESLMIVALAAALAVLVVYRRRRADERERERRQQLNGNGGAGAGAGQQIHQQAQEQRDRLNLFPQRGDPEFLGWAAGGVGH